MPLWDMGEGVGQSLEDKGKFTGTVTQINPVKQYRYGLQFFVHVVPDDDEIEEFMCMFDAGHVGKFKVGDRITFEASVSLPKQSGDPAWFRIKAGMEVQKLGAGKIEEERKTFDVSYVGYPKPRGTRGVSSFCLVGDDWVLELPEPVMESFFTGIDLDGREPASIGGGLYALLRVPANATGKEIQRGFRRMARLYHPDVSDHPDAEEKFKKINDAYGKLSDPALREKHDQWLEMLDRGGSFVDVDAVSVSAPGGYFVPPHRCGMIEVVADCLGSRWKAKEIVTWRVEEREFQTEVPLAKVEYYDWGIAVASLAPRYGEFAAYFSRSPVHTGFEVDNSQLPFTSKQSLSRGKTKRLGSLEVMVRAHRVAMWDRFSQAPKHAWEVDRVLSASLKYVGDDVLKVLGLKP